MILYTKELSQIPNEDLFEYLHYVEQLKLDADIQRQTYRLEDALKEHKNTEANTMLLYGLVAGTQYKYGISLEMFLDEKIVRKLKLEQIKNQINND